tara:strand:- start:284 stop:901 length:618 start_codon:yes stop_codon:yes gene_type:complete
MIIIKKLSQNIILIFYLGLFSSISGAESRDPNQYNDMVKGNIDSVFTIVEYASFTCPHCATFHKEVLPYLEKKYIETGKVKFVYREVYFDAPGLWAGLIARCVNQDKYFGIVDLIYEKQEKWASGSSEKEILRELLAIGRQVGMEEEEINSCLQNKEKSLSMIDAYLTNSKLDNITSTPSLVINGELIDYVSFDDLKTKIDGILN